MSMLCCERCSEIVDTDENPEWFREDLNDKHLCDRCYGEEIEYMSSSKHTKGPWRVEACRRYNCKCNKYLVEPVMGSEGYLEFQDALLIAAAPEALIQLKHASQQLKGSAELMRYYNVVANPALFQGAESNLAVAAMLDEVIAKAEGRS